MARANRDDFSDKTRQAIALRANNECSFPRCATVMSGPSLESPHAYLSNGVAAHIHAAASGPGARRYLASMSPEERSSAANGIWLCRNHAAEIDQDGVTYTADMLREMKANHESSVVARRRGTAPVISLDFVALGPSIVMYGDVIEASDREWKLRVTEFLLGDLYQLLGFIDSFSTMDPHDRYVTINKLGDGRQLAGPPTWAQTNAGYVLTCPILTRFPRIPAQELPREFALNEKHDVFADNGTWMVVSGLEALPQRIKSSLSLIRGESPMYPAVGTRITDFFESFRDSDLLANLVKLEAIRMACIPIASAPIAKPSTMLGCVQRVRSIEQLSRTADDRWLPFRFVLDVEGVSEPWQRDIAILVQAAEQQRVDSPDRVSADTSS